MSQSIHVVGLTTIGITSGSTLGQTDENNDISFETVLGEKKIFTNASGPHMPAAVINHGLIGKLRVPLISWDESVLQTLAERQASAAAEGQIGVLGAALAQFSLTLTTTTSGERSYVFPFARLVDSYTIEKFGYEAKRLVLNFEVIPNPSALATATTPLYTFSTN